VFFFKIGHPAVLQITDNVTTLHTSVVVQHVSAFLVCRHQAKHILNNSRQKAFYIFIFMYYTNFF
jgi:hypothetical protein